MDKLNKKARFLNSNGLKGGVVFCCLIGFALVPLLKAQLTPPTTIKNNYYGSWSSISSVNAPTARKTSFSSHSYWTGTEMIVWGGNDGTDELDDGAMYNPSTDTWTTISPLNRPAGILNSTSIWTGSEMIVWRGSDASSNPVLTGSRFNPSTNTWTTVTDTNAPTIGLEGFTSVWTGTEWILWGGGLASSSIVYGDGARYNPSTDTWTTMSAVNAPTARRFHGSVLIGNDLIVWGGEDASSDLGDGAVYNIPSDTWTTITSSGAPVAGQPAISTIYAGKALFVLPGVPNYGGVYDVGTDSWVSIASSPVEFGAFNGGFLSPSFLIDGDELWVFGKVEVCIKGCSTTRYMGFYNLLTSTWTDVVSPNEPDTFTQGFFEGDSIYATVGTWRIFERSTRRWKSITPKNRPGSKTNAFNVFTGSQVVVWGGDEASTPTATGAVFSPD